MKKDLVINVLNLITKCARQRYTKSQWKEVLKYKIDNDLKNNNEAVVKLIKKGLEKNKFDFGK